MFFTVWDTQRFTELGRKEKGEGGDRQPGGEKGESKGGESGQVSNLALKYTALGSYEGVIPMILGSSALYVQE